MLFRTKCLSALACVAATPALAADALPRALTDNFYVTLEEVRANSEATFQTFAGPDGGPISRKEFVSFDLPEKVGPSGTNPDLLGQLFGRLDVNGDGQLTRAEWKQRIEKDLAFADANGDGLITLKELSNARENMGFGEALGMLF